MLLKTVPAHTQETAQNHGQMGKFPTKGSEGTWKWIFFPNQEAQTDNSLCRKVILHLGAVLCSKDGEIHEIPGMNASLDLAEMLNLNLIRQEKRLGFNSSSEFITAVNRREPGKQYIMLLQHFWLQAPKFQHFQLV